MISHKLLIGMPSLFLALEIIKTLPFWELGRENRKDNVLFNNDFVLGEKYFLPVQNSKLQNLVTKT